MRSTPSAARISRPEISKAILLTAKVLAALAVLSWVVLLGQSLRAEPNHCPAGFARLGARCCAPGQALSIDGACEGTPTSCPPPTQFTAAPSPGCLRLNSRVRVEGGEVSVGATDWDVASVSRGQTFTVRPFLIDSLEVNLARYDDCRTAGVCRGRFVSSEPGSPVTGLNADDAEAFCAFAGGHLPTVAQWTFAAMGSEARRFPWGAHGLVCRRAAYGLAEGPCGQGALRPELGGMRPDGATPLGVFDLAGNVAEWTRDESGAPLIKGGSFRSKLAADLKNVGHGGTAVTDDVGFRCAYPIAGIEEAVHAQPQATKESEP